MSNFFQQRVLQSLAIAASLLIAGAAQAVTIVKLKPVYPGTITGVTPYTSGETLKYEFTVKSPYSFVFTAVGSGGNFPFPISVSGSGTHGSYVETFGAFPVHGTVDYTLTTAVPEPASWAMMIGGFGVLGGYARRRRTALAIA